MLNLDYPAHEPLLLSRSCSFEMAQQEGRYACQREGKQGRMSESDAWNFTDEVFNIFDPAFSTEARVGYIVGYLTEAFHLSSQPSK